MTKTITKTTISALILAATLTTGLLAGALPTIEAIHEPCPRKTVTVVIDGNEMGPFDIKGYTYSSSSETFMFTHEPDDDATSGLSAKILAAIKNGDKVDIHFDTCKLFKDGTKTHQVWLTDGELTDVSETSGDDDDDFPTEKVSGEFSEIMRMTTTTPPVEDWNQLKFYIPFSFYFLNL